MQSSNAKYKINPIVLIATPTLETRPVSWDWMDAMAALQFPLGASVSKLRISGEDVAEARNQIVKTALNLNADYVLMIGDDNLPPPNLFSLLQRHRKELVTGVYWQKSYPTHPYLWDGLLKGFYEDWKYGEFFPIDFGGCDALLAETEVFRNIAYPWFSRDWTFEPGQEVPLNLTEDFYFYAKAKEAGYRLWVDTAAQLGHQDRTTGVIFGLAEGMPQLDARAPHPSEEGELLVADIGAGMESPWFGAKAKIVRYDLNPKVNPDVRCDIRAIPAEDQYFDRVHSRHVLEHFMWQEAPDLIKEWARILKVGGEMVINVPNVAFAASEIIKADADPNYDPGMYPLWQLYGRQDGSCGEVHRNGFTIHGVGRLLESVGLEVVTLTKAGEFNENILAVARKTRHETPLAIGPIMRATADPEDGARSDLGAPPSVGSSSVGEEVAPSSPTPSLNKTKAKKHRKVLRKHLAQDPVTLEV